MNRQSLSTYWPPILGGIVALAAALLLRTLADVRLLAELALDAMVQILPGQDFSSLLGVFGPYGKALFFLSVLIAQLAVHALIWARIRLLAVDAGTSTVRLALGSALAATLAMLAVSALLIVATDATLGTQTSWLEYAFATAMTSGLYASVAGLQALGRSPQPGGEADGGYADESRRRFLARIPGLALGGLALLVIADVLRDAAGGGVQRSRRGQPTPEVTPNDEFYVVSKNLIDPRVERSGWRLSVGGQVLRPPQLRYEDLLAQPAQEQYTTLQCISNYVGDELISNALWRGVPLPRLLELAAPAPTARYVMFSCADGYTESLPLDFAMREQVVLAYQMNGEPLSDKHGFPVRLLSPGKYGIKHPKWITEIKLIDEEYFGYWQRQGWSQEARMNTSTRIDIPPDGARLSTGVHRIEGIAFSGDRGISRVEVSTDDKRSWEDATLKSPLGPYTWALWHYDWQLPRQMAGMRTTVWARATDGNGDLQTEVVAEPYPSGATGYHLADVRIEAENGGSPSPS
jgi:DMSO/TMAO reductase YedYZ molybdopterin-dependent catalytic subunit